MESNGEVSALGIWNIIHRMFRDLVTNVLYASSSVEHLSWSQRKVMSPSSKSRSPTETNNTLTSVAHWVGCCPTKQKGTSSIPSQGTCLGSRPGPNLRACERQLINVSLSLSPSLLVFLKINK